MRDLILIAVIFGGLLATLRYPFVGLLLWAWYTLATPHQAAYLASTLPLNAVIAGVTVISFFFHKEFAKVRIRLVPVLLLLFGFWLWVAQTQSLDPDTSAAYYDRFIKILVFVFLCMMVITSRLRFHAVLWLYAIVMGFYGAKGGFYTIATLGQNLYFGLPDNILYDNNHMGIALATSLPIFLYLQGQASHPLIKRGVQAVFVLTIIAVLGTHSRGAFVALVVFAAILFVRSWRNFSIGLISLVIAGPVALVLLPDKWFDRMSTIQSATDDTSFMGRVDAWVINYKLAVKHPLTGAGLRTAYQEKVSQQVDPFRTPRAAHSIYFEILGGTGFVGLFIYLALLGTALLTAFTGYRKFMHSVRDRWRSDFALQAQSSLMVFGVGGASVSMEMWEGYLILIALISVLGRIGQNETSDVMPKFVPKTTLTPKAGQQQHHLPRKQTTN